MTSFQLASEFLSGSSTSAGLQPPHYFHSKPAQTTQCPCQHAFLSALKETPTNEQHRQASNDAAPNEDRIRIQSSHRHRLGGHAALFLLYRVASEIEIPHSGPGRQVEVGLEDD
jgi:hypothetical protein